MKKLEDCKFHQSSNNYILLGFCITLEADLPRDPFRPSFGEKQACHLGERAWDWREREI